MEKRTPKGSKGKRATAKRGGAAGRDKAAARTIWHIVDWQTSFEPDDAMRKRQKSPLSYVKLHIKGRGGLSQQQLDLQRRLLLSEGGGVEAWSVYTLCCIVSGNRGEDRGYLWNDQNEPASAREIAVMIGLDVAVVRKALPLLERRRFLERVAVPEKRPWKAPIPDEPGQIPDESGQIPDASGKPPDAAGQRPDAAGRAGYNKNGNGNDERERKPEHEPDDQQHGTAGGNGLVDGKKRAAPAAAGAKPERPPGPPDNGQTAPAQQKGVPGAQEGRTTRPPAQQRAGTVRGDQGRSRGPQKPQETDGVEGEGAFSPPPSSDSRAAGPESQAANLATKDAENLFGQAVCVALDVGRGQYHREHASLVTAWQAALATGLNKVALQEFWKKAVAMATEIRKRKKRPRKPGAVWWTRMDGYMAQQIGQKRWGQAKAGIIKANENRRLERTGGNGAAGKQRKGKRP